MGCGCSFDEPPKQQQVIERAPQQHQTRQIIQANSQAIVANDGQGPQYGTATRITAGVGIGISRRRVRVTLVLDKSGSMSGGKWNEVVNGVQQIFRVLDPQDTVTCITFNNAPDLLCAFEEVRSTSLISKLKRVQCANATALYDAASLATVLNIKQLVTDVQASAAAGVGLDMHMVVVLTDGEDTSSSVTKSEVTELLRSLHTKIGSCQTIFIGVGLRGVGLRNLQQIVNGVRDQDCKLLAVNNCDLRDVFVQLSVSLERMAQVQRVTVTPQGVAYDHAIITREGIQGTRTVVQR